MSITLGNAILYLQGDNSRLTRDLNDAKGQATSWAGSLGGWLNNGIGTALGIFSTQVVGAAIQGIQSVATAALTSVADYERLGMSLQNLVARELMRGEQSTQTSTVIQHLTQAEINKLRQLTDEQAIAQGNVLSLQAKFDAEWTAVQASGQAWSAELTTLNAKIDLAKMKVEGYGKEIDTLNARNGQAATITKLVMTGQMEQADAMAAAIPKAKELLDWIIKLAIQSPFTQAEVSNSFRLAMAYGFTTDEAKRMTQATIDFASGSGASGEAMGRIALALGQIKAKGKLAGQEVLQLVNAGLPVTEILAKAFHKTTAEIESMRENGLIKAKDAIDAIVASLEEDFGGAAQRQATSWAGLTSTLADIKSVGLREFFTGTFTAIQPYVASFVDAFTNGDLQAKIRDVGVALGEKVKVGMEWLKDNAVPIWNDLQKWAKYFVWAVQDGQSPLEVITKILKAMGFPTWVTDGLTNLQKFWDDNGDTLTTGIDTIATSLGKLATDAVKGAFKAATEWLVINGPDIARAVETIGTWIRDTLIPALEGLGGWVVAHKDEVIGFLLGWAAAMALANAAAFAGSLLMLVNPLTILAALLGLAVGWFVQYGEGILGANAATATFVQKLEVGFFGALVAASTAINQLGFIIAFKLTELLLSVSTFGSDIGKSWAGIWESAKTILSTAWANMWTAIDTKITEIKTSITIFFTDVKKKFTDEYESFKKLGGDLIDNVLIGITMKVSQVIEAVKKMVADAIAAAGKALGEANPFDSPDATDATDDGTPRASGGPVRAGQSYIVGEKRAEWFIPDTNGFILPGVPQVAPITAPTAGNQSQPLTVNLWMDGHLVGKVSLDGALDELSARGQVIALPVA